MDEASLMAADIERIAAHKPASGWRPISEAHIGVPCLVYSPERGIDIMTICLNAEGKKVCRDSDFIYDLLVYGFTHAMPLPDAPPASVGGA